MSQIKNPDSPVIERRKFGRRNVIMEGRVYVPGRTIIYCNVANVGAGGAFLEMQVPLWLPDQFSITYGNQSEHFGCIVRHRQVNGVGVSFCDYKEEPPISERTITDWLGIRGRRRK